MSVILIERNRVFLILSLNEKVLSPKLYSVIDVETTGGQPSNSKITDISIFVTNGYEVLDEFSSLVNPNMPIPEFITQLTGIDDDMVSEAPLFEEIARKIIEITENTTFVAHNVNFDFGMVSGEFERLGYSYEREKLCTVRLARKYIPGHRSYSLGNICGELGIPINGRHRARGDAEATVELFNIIMNASEGYPTVQNEKWINNLPAHISRTQVDSLPQGPGIYYLKDANENVIDLDASEHVQKAIIKLLQSKAKKSKEIKSQLHTIESEPYGWSLIAQLKALDEKQKSCDLKPKKTAKSPSFGLSIRFDLFGYANLSIEKIKPNAEGERRFHSLKEGRVFIKGICEQHKICDSLSGIELKSGCKNLTCKGACRQLELAEKYNERVLLAINNTSQSQRNFALIQKNGDQEIRQVVLVENDELVGFGELNSDQAIYDKKQISEIIKVEKSTKEKMIIIENYVIKETAKFDLVYFEK